MEFTRTVTTDAPTAEVFRYLADFTTTTEWEPATVTTTRVSGDGGVGTTYRNVTRFMGRDTELTYVVDELVEGSRIRLRGHNKALDATDTMTVRALPSGGTEVTYQAAFAMKGLARLLAPAFRPALRRLVDNAQKGLGAALDRLAA